jgi:general secretion pathway protein K
VTPANGAGGQRGFALILVLWSIGLMSLIIAGLSADGRTQARLAADARASAMAEAAAQGAVQHAIFMLSTGTWAADNLPRRIRIGTADVVVTIEDQNQRINPNLSPPPLLAAILGVAGLDPGSAMMLARRIMDWRTGTVMSIAGGLKIDLYRQAGLRYGPPNRPFESVEEIGLVPGMTPALMQRLRPLLSVYQAGDPGAAVGAGESVAQVAEMINHASVMAGFNSPYRVVQIQASAAIQNGARFTRTAVVRLPRTPDAQSPAWQILTWN